MILRIQVVLDELIHQVTCPMHLESFGSLLYDNDYPQPTLILVTLA